MNKLPLRKEHLLDKPRLHRKLLNNNLVSLHHRNNRYLSNKQVLRRLHNNRYRNNKTLLHRNRRLRSNSRFNNLKPCLKEDRSRLRQLNLNKKYMTVS